MRIPIAAVLVMLLACCAPTTSDDTAGGASGPARVLLQGGVLSVQTGGDGTFLTTSIPVTPDRLWELLPGAYRLLGLQATEADAANRVLVFDDRIARVDGRRLSEFLDCGRGVAGPNANTYDVTLRVTTQIVPADDGGEARARVDATARNRGTSGSSVSCRTTGELEERLFDVLAGLATGG